MLLRKILTIPKCSLCGKVMQGHLKYKRKTFCLERKMSTSEKFKNHVFNDFEDFKRKVDEYNR